MIKFMWFSSVVLYLLFVIPAIVKKAATVVDKLSCCLFCPHDCASCLTSTKENDNV
jgi:hypothetical protein